MIGGGQEAKAKVEYKVTNKLMDGGKRTNGRVQDSGRVPTERPLAKQKNQ